MPAVLRGGLGEEAFNLSPEGIRLYRIFDAVSFFLSRAVSSRAAFEEGQTVSFQGVGGGGQ